MPYRNANLTIRIVAPTTGTHSQCYQLVHGVMPQSDGGANRISQSRCTPATSKHTATPFPRPNEDGGSTENVELAGLEPASKQGTSRLSTCLSDAQLSGVA